MWTTEARTSSSERLGSANREEYAMNTPQTPTSGSLHPFCSPRYPRNLLRRVWVCCVLRRKQYRAAAAASTLVIHAWNTGDNDLWEQMEQLQNKLWADVYAEENKALSNSHEN